MASLPFRLGSYVVYGVIDGGDMASVHFGRMLGNAGFRRTVAVKRLHPHLANDAEFVRPLLDEAHLVARIRHPNVVATHDIVEADGEVAVVMEYVPGESLARLFRIVGSEHTEIPLPIISAIVAGALRGLHAAHEAKSEEGSPLHI